MGSEMYSRVVNLLYRSLVVWVWYGVRGRRTTPLGYLQAGASKFQGQSIQPQVSKDSTHGLNLVWLRFIRWKRDLI